MGKIWLFVHGLQSKIYQNLTGVLFIIVQNAASGIDVTKADNIICTFSILLKIIMWKVQFIKVIKTLKVNAYELFDDNRAIYCRRL